MGKDPTPPSPPSQPRVLPPVDEGRVGEGVEDGEDVVAQQGKALTTTNEGDGGSLAPNESDSARVNGADGAEASSLPPPPQALMLPLPFENPRISSSSNNNNNSADLLLLRRCQRDAHLLMDRRYRVTSAGRSAAEPAVEEERAEPNLDPPRETDDAECCDDDDDGGAEAKEASRHNHPILYIATEHPLAFRTDHRDPLDEDHQYHYVVTAASSSTGVDGHIQHQAGGGGDGSILSSLKDSYVDEARGLDEPSRRHAPDRTGRSRP
jgi:hypothetical protein